MNDEEQQRVRRYMYDKDANMLTGTPLGVYAIMLTGVAALCDGEEGVTDAPQDGAEARLIAFMTLDSSS